MQHINRLVNPTDPATKTGANYQTANEYSKGLSDSKHALNASGERLSELSTRNQKIIIRIWSRMLALYGHKWQSNYGDPVDDHGNLTEPAMVWQEELAGITVEQMATAFAALGKTANEWPPGIFEFKRLCLKRGDMPSIDEVIKILVMPKSGGTIAQRYQHPFVLAVAMKIDKYELSRASTEKARKLVKPVYEKILAEGWDDWPENAHTEQKALEAQPPKPRYMKPEDILAMMREALKAPSGSESARLERLKSARESHEVLLAEHYKAGNIRRVVSERHSCCRCNKPGTLSAEVSGNGHWYCADHYTG